MSTYNAGAGQRDGKWTPRPGISAGSDQIDVATAAFQKAANEDRATFGNAWPVLTVDGKLGPNTANVARQIRRMPEYQVGGYLVMNALQLLESLVNFDQAPVGGGGSGGGTTGGGGGTTGGGGGGGTGGGTDVVVPPSGVIVPPRPGPAPAAASGGGVLPWLAGAALAVGAWFALKPKKRRGAAA